MKIDDKKIRDILLQENYVKAEEIEKAEKFAKSHHKSILDYLMSQGIITKNLLGQAIAEFFGVVYADMKAKQPSPDQIIAIPEEIALKHRLVLFSQSADSVTLTSDNPHAGELPDELREIFKGKRIKLAYSLPEDIEAIFARYRKPLKTRFDKIIENQNRVAPEIMAEIISDAEINRASDIHFEPQPKEVVVRFRVDGVLNEVARIPKMHYENVLNRIKVQARLRIDEHFSAQDGAIRFVKDGRTLDLRVSIIPTLDGEKVTVRLLGQYIQGFTLTDLGLSESDHKIIKETTEKPFGMILVTGPTGSGKTTTLYAFLKILNRPGVNITTIEDPVEYKIIGTNQIQVNPETNLTFSQGLRSIIRQDPDIVLVGEIRDSETAEIAVNAALTGHLLLSTFHANDAATAIPRLLDMKVEPFLLASTLEIVVAQRLVRKICDNCRYSKTQKVDSLSKFATGNGFAASDFKTVYLGKGCDSCGGTGYKGRVAIFEIIQVTREMKDLILKNPSTKQIWDLAQSQGSHSLFSDGLEKVKSGLTTIEELIRVAPPPIAQNNNAKK